MSTLQTFLAALSAVVLFLYGLQGFSREVRAVGGQALNAWLGRVTARRWRGFLAGALATAVVQSSSAVTALAVALVDAGAMTFRASLGVLLGANVGTTATAWLVSLKLTGIGPVFIVVGAVWSMLPFRASVAGKALFYFGLIFFALDLVGAALKPLGEGPALRSWLALAGSPVLGVLAGLIFTALVQSSSVTTGLGIILVQQGTLAPEAAVAIVIGANIGTTSTALVASLGMRSAARSTAIANFAFNLAGVLLYLPFLRSFGSFVTRLAPDPGMAVAWAHLVFNLTVALLFMVLLGKLENRLARWFALGTEGNP